MTALTFVQIPDSEPAQTRLAALERAYIARVPAPLDGMWQTFAQYAVPYGVFDGDLLVACCRVDSERRALAFSAEASTKGRALFAAAITQLELVGAVASTADVTFTSLCLDKQQRVNVNALQYEISGPAAVPSVFPEATTFAPVTTVQLPAAVAFGAKTIGADAGWLKGYYGGLVERGELYGLWRGDSLLATGELRPSTTQPTFADVGMVVGAEVRRQGLATNILRALIQTAQAIDLSAVCSTEVDNTPAQRAIAAAGFVPRHRIVAYDF